MRKVILAVLISLGGIAATAQTTVLNSAIYKSVSTNRGVEVGYLDSDGHIQLTTMLDEKNLRKLRKRNAGKIIKPSTNENFSVDNQIRFHRDQQTKLKGEGIGMIVGGGIGAFFLPVATTPVWIVGIVKAVNAGKHRRSAETLEFQKLSKYPPMGG